MRGAPRVRAGPGAGPRRGGRVALAGNPSLRSVPSRVRSGPCTPTDNSALRLRSERPELAEGRRTGHRLGQRDDRSSRSDSPLRKTRLRSGCARLGSRPPRRRRKGSRPGARAAGRGGSPQHGSGTRAERVLSLDFARDTLSMVEGCAAGCGCAGVDLRQTPAGGRFRGVLIGEPCPPRRAAGHRAGASVPGLPDSARGASPRPAAAKRSLPGVLRGESVRSDRGGTAGRYSSSPKSPVSSGARGARGVISSVSTAGSSSALRTPSSFSRRAVTSTRLSSEPTARL
jgi:hypothetical protein